MTTPLIEILGPEKHRRYRRLRNRHGAHVARKMVGLPPCGTAPKGWGRGFVPLIVPEKGMPQVRWIFEEINRQHLPGAEVTHRAGLSKNILADWRGKGQAPILGNIEAIANVLGFTFRPSRMVDNDEREIDASADAIIAP